MNIAIVGAGGFGREVYALIKQINAHKQQFNPIGFIDDGLPKNTPVHDLSVLGSVGDLESINPEGVVIAIGNSAVRKRVVEQINVEVDFPNIIHPTAQIIDAPRVKLGKGNIICAGSILTTDIVIKDFCIVNIGSTIGHDALLSNFCSIMPSVNISGGAQLQQAVYVGTGAKLIKATTLGENCIIGAGAVVDSNIPTNCIAVGIPAKPIKTSHG